MELYSHPPSFLGAAVNVTSGACTSNSAALSVAVAKQRKDVPQAGRDRHNALQGWVPVVFTAVTMKNVVLTYKTPVRTSQETHYVSATESNKLMLCKI
jgi:hypothetical protein